MSMSQSEKSELACVYAGLLLFDDKIEITADKINKILKASGNDKVDSYYPEFFASYFKTADINSLLSASPAPASAAPAEDKKEDKKDDKKGGKDKKDDKKKKEEKKKVEEEEEEGMFDMFG